MNYIGESCSPGLAGYRRYLSRGGNVLGMLDIDSVEAKNSCLRSVGQLPAIDK